MRLMFALIFSIADLQSRCVVHARSIYIYMDIPIYNHPASREPSRNSWSSHAGDLGLHEMQVWSSHWGISCSFSLLIDLLCRPFLTLLVSLTVTVEMGSQSAMRLPLASAIEVKMHIALLLAPSTRRHHGQMVNALVTQTIPCRSNTKDPKAMTTTTML